MSGVDLLVASLGTGNYLKGLYADEPNQPAATFSSTVVAQLSEARSVLIIATERAIDLKGADLRTEICAMTSLSEERVKFAAVELGPTLEDVMRQYQEILRQALSKDKTGEETQAVSSDKQNPPRVVLDLTHGFRYQPMILLMSSLQLQACERLTINEAYYSEAPSEDGAPAKLIRLMPMLELVRWTEMVQSFRKSHRTEDAVEILRELAQNVGRKGDGATRKELTRLSSLLSRAGFAAQAGLAKELTEDSEITTFQTGQGLQARLREELSFASDPIDAMLSELSKIFRLDLSGESSAGTLPPSMRVLMRFVDILIERGSLSNAASVAMETVISRVLYAQNQSWSIALSVMRKNRELGLRLLSNALRDRRFSLEWPKLAETLTKIRDIRNFLQHAGFSESLQGSATSLEKIKEKLTASWAEVQVALSRHEPWNRLIAIAERSPERFDSALIVVRGESSPSGWADRLDGISAEATLVIEITGASALDTVAIEAPGITGKIRRIRGTAEAILRASTLPFPIRDGLCALFVQVDEDSVTGLKLARKVASRVAPQGRLFEAVWLKEEGGKPGRRVAMDDLVSE